MPHALENVAERIGWHRLWVSLASLAAYSTSFTPPFFSNWDDNFYVTENVRTQTPGWQGLQRVWDSSDTWVRGFIEFFPLRDTVYWATWQLFGDNVVAFHAVNIAAHTAVALLVLQLGRKLGFGATVALWGALLFAVHPVHVESVTWVAALKDPLYLGLMLASVLCYLNYRESLKPLQYGLSVGFLVASLLCKSLALPLPLILLAIELTAERRVGWKEVLARVTGPGLVCLLFAVQFVLIGKANAVLVPPHGGSWGAHYLIMGWGLVRYVQQALVPATFNLYYCVAPLNGADPRLLGLVAGAVALIAALWFSRRSPRARLLLAWFFACLLPVANLMPFPAVIADRYLYGSTVASCLAVAWGAQRIGRMGRVLALSAVGLFGLVTFSRGLLWENEANLWDEIAGDPACRFEGVLVYLNHAATTADPTAALKSSEAAFAHREFPGLTAEIRADAHSVAARRALELGEPARARQFAALAVADSPEDPRLLIQLARLPGNPAAGVAAAKRALDLQPSPVTRTQWALSMINAGAADQLSAVRTQLQEHPQQTCPLLANSLPDLPEGNAVLSQLQSLCAAERP